MTCSVICCPPSKKTPKTSRRKNTLPKVQKHSCWDILPQKKHFPPKKQGNKLQCTPQCMYRRAVHHSAMHLWSTYHPYIFPTTHTTLCTTCTPTPPYIRTAHPLLSSMHSTTYIQSSTILTPHYNQPNLHGNTTCTPFEIYFKRHIQIPHSQAQTKMQLISKTHN